MLKQVRDQQGRLSHRSIDFIMQQMREVINAKEMAAAIGSNQMSTQPLTSQQQQQTVATPTTVATSDSPTLSNNIGSKITPSKKQPTEKVTVRTLPKKQVGTVRVF